MSHLDALQLPASESGIGCDIAQQRIDGLRRTCQCSFSNLTWMAVISFIIQVVLGKYGVEDLRSSHQCSSDGHQNEKAATRNSYDIVKVVIDPLPGQLEVQ